MSELSCGALGSKHVALLSVTHAFQKPDQFCTNQHQDSTGSANKLWPGSTAPRKIVPHHQKPAHFYAVTLDNHWTRESDLPGCFLQSKAVRVLSNTCSGKMCLKLGPESGLKFVCSFTETGIGACPVLSGRDFLEVVSL